MRLLPIPIRPRMKTTVRSAPNLRTAPPGPSTRAASMWLPAWNQSACASRCFIPLGQATRQLTRRPTSLHSRCGFRGEGGCVLSQLVVRALRGLNSQLVVGAARRSAAPGGQSIGAAGYGSILFHCCYSSPMLSKVQHHVFQRKASCPRARPNPSIERTRTGRPRYACSSFYVPRGLPVRAAHVKR